MNKLFIINVVCLVSVINAESLFLSHIKNDTPDTLYKIIVPDEDYEVLVPPGTDADFGSWLDLRRDKEVQLAALSGDGEAAFINLGPESAGCSDNEAFAQSVVYWIGNPSASNEDKLYKTCCLTSSDLNLMFTMHANGVPELEEIKDNVK